MKRIEYDRHGGPERMHLAEVEGVMPGPDEPRVRMRAAAVNPIDWKVHQGEMAIHRLRRDNPRS